MLSWLSRFSQVAFSTVITRSIQPSKNVATLACSNCISRLKLAERVAPFQPWLQLQPPQQQQVRHRYVGWRMWRDEKRRRTIKQYGKQKLRLQALRKNSVLPQEIQELAKQQVAEFPRDAHSWRLKNRCVLTSRPNGNVPRWRLSRIVWRHLADYNKLSGVTRSWW